MAKHYFYVIVFFIPVFCIGQSDVFYGTIGDKGNQVSEDLKDCSFASSEEKGKHTSILKYQLGVDVSYGESTKPIYYYHNQKNETIYKYEKKIALSPDIDCWYPVQPERICACGTIKDIYNTAPDFTHTYLTQDRDFNIVIDPMKGSDKYLKNRWAKINGHSEKFKFIEAEVNVDDLDKENLGNKYSNKNNSTNPIFRNKTIIKKKQKICLYGPWMWDKLAGLKVFTKDGQGNNEIHPINQFWFGSLKSGLTLTSVVDGSGQFTKEDKDQVVASGKSQAMRYYIPITIKDGKLTRFVIKGEEFDTFMGPLGDNDSKPLTLFWNNKKVVEIIRFYSTSKKMYKAFFSQMRKLSDSQIQGYLVVETEAIHSDRGSITVTVKQL